MARESIELQQKRIESDEEMTRRNSDAFEAEQAALDRLHDFASMTPAEKQAETRAESSEAVAAHEAKSAAPPAQNKSITPPTENKAAVTPAHRASDHTASDHTHDALEGVSLTPAAERKARAAGLTAEDFKRRKKSGNDGEFTVADVERIAEAKG